MIILIRKKYIGFTFLEVILTIIIIGVLVAASVPLFNQGFTSTVYGQDMTNENWQAQLAMRRMANDFHNITTATSITTILSNKFVFTDSAGSTVTYQYSGNNLLRNNQVLASGISNFVFGYYDNAGATTSTVSAVSYVKVTINITQNAITDVFQTMFYLGNLT